MGVSGWKPTRGPEAFSAGPCACRGIRAFRVAVGSRPVSGEVAVLHERNSVRSGST